MHDIVTFCSPFCFPSSFLKPQELLFGERHLAPQRSGGCRRGCWNWWLNYWDYGCGELAAEKKSCWIFTHRIFNTTPKLHALTHHPQSSLPDLIHGPQTYTPSTLPQLILSSYTYGCHPLSTQSHIHPSRMHVPSWEHGTNRRRHHSSGKALRLGNKTSTEVEGYIREGNGTVGITPQTMKQKKYKTCMQFDNE